MAEIPDPEPTVVEPARAAATEPASGSEPWESAQYCYTAVHTVKAAAITPIKTMVMTTNRTSLMSLTTKHIVCLLWLDFLSALDSSLFTTLESSFKASVFLMTHFPVTVAATYGLNTVIAEFAIFVHS